MKYLMGLLLATLPLVAGDIQRNQIEAILPKLESFTEEGMKISNVPGTAIGIVHNGELIYAKGFGYRNVEAKQPVEKDTVFQIASLSKPITSSILAALVEAGSLDWDSKIEDLDPSFRLSDPWVSAHLTIRDLLSHRSGIPDHGGDLLEDLGYDKETILHQLRYIAPLGAFRQQYAYTNFGFSEAAYAAAKKMNLSWPELAKRELFGPLGMTSTSSQFKDFIRSNKRATTYTIQEGRAIPLKQPREPDAQSPAGGVSTNVLDLAKWMQLELDAIPKGNMALLATQTPVITTHVNEKTGQPSFYGMGWDISFDEQGRRYLKHSGGFALGVRTQASLLPEESIGIVILTNASPSGLPEAISKAFYAFLFGEELEKGIVQRYNEMWLKYETDPIVHFQVDPKKVSPSLSLEHYAGTYENDYYGPIKIAHKGKELTLTIGPKPMTFPLKHLNRDVFAMPTQGENAVGETQVIFTLDESQHVRSVTVDYLNKFGMGVFKSDKDS